MNIDTQQLLIEAKNLIEHAFKSRAVGFMDWNHKTAPSLVMVPSNAKETIRKLKRANRRAR